MQCIRLLMYSMCFQTILQVNIVDGYGQMLRNTQRVWPIYGYCFDVQPAVVILGCRTLHANGKCADVNVVVGSVLQAGANQLSIE